MGNDKNWRAMVDPQIRPFLEALVKEVLAHKNNYMSAENPGGAQIWIALAVLAKQISDINSRIKVIEKALSDANLQKNSQSAVSIPKLKKKDAKIKSKAEYGKKEKEDPAKILSNVLKRL